MKTNIINRGSQITESWQPSYWIAAAKLLNRGSQITESRQPNYWKLQPSFDHLGSRGKANARRGEQPGDYERQLGASGGGRCVRRAPEPGEIKGTRAPKGSTR